MPKLDAREAAWAWDRKVLTANTAGHALDTWPMAGTWRSDASIVEVSIVEGNIECMARGLWEGRKRRSSCKHPQHRDKDQEEI